MLIIIWSEACAVSLATILSFSFFIQTTKKFHARASVFVSSKMEKSYTIGSDTWKNASVRNIKLSQMVVGRSDKACDMGQQLDPLPSLRDTCIQQSNARIQSYARATRAVLVKLRENLLDTNEEIKSLIRGKEHLEKTLEHIRKDIKLNLQSMSIRKTRPAREKVQNYCLVLFCC